MNRCRDPLAGNFLVHSGSWAPEKDGGLQWQAYTHTMQFLPLLSTTYNGSNEMS